MGFLDGIGIDSCGFIGVRGAGAPVWRLGGGGGGVSWRCTRLWLGSSVKAGLATFAGRVAGSNGGGSLRGVGLEEEADNMPGWLMCS